MHADSGAWLRALAELEARTADLLRDYGELHIHPGNGIVYRWRARCAWRLWRRKRPLFECLGERYDASGSFRRGHGL